MDEVTPLTPEETDKIRADCDVGFVFALSFEAGGLVDRLQSVVTTRGSGFLVRQGLLDETRIVIVESGMGQKAATHAAEALQRGHRPRWIVSAGFAGGLDQRMARNDILLAERVVNPGGQQIVIEPAVDLQKFLEAPGVHSGRLLTLEKMVHLPEERRALGSEHDALALDMETFAVAEFCRRQNSTFLSVRVISDTVDEQLPQDVLRIGEQKSKAGRFGAFLGALFRRPSSVKDMFKLKEVALVASDRLADVLIDLIRLLVSNRSH